MFVTLFASNFIAACRRASGPVLELSMADAYLCAMPMSYELLSQTPISETFSISNKVWTDSSPNVWAGTLDATGYTYASIKIASATASVLNDYRKGVTFSANFRFDNGSTMHDGSKGTVHIDARDTANCAIPALTWEGPLTDTEITIYVCASGFTGTSSDDEQGTITVNCVISGYLRR